MSKKQKSQSNREAVRAQVAAAARAEKRMKVVFRSLIGVAVLALVAVIAVVAMNRDSNGGDLTADVTADGVAFAGVNGEPVAVDDVADSDVPHVDLYLDFTCPHCFDFETANADFLNGQVADGNMTMALHPVAIMDGASRGTAYSSRAANAAYCVAENDADSFLDVNSALFDHREPSITGQLSDNDLAETIANMTNEPEAVQDCIKGGHYSGAVHEATMAAIEDESLASHTGSFGTPTVAVDGNVCAGSWTDTAGLARFIGIG